MCATCHDSTDPLVIAAIATGDVTCDACHPGAGNHEALHDGGLEGQPAYCQGCHADNIYQQHGYNVNICVRCHESTDPLVIAAIAAGDVTCDACHVPMPDHQAEHDGGLVGTTGCDGPGCHVDNISTQHGDNCETCHGSSDPLVIAAIHDGDVTCGACHPGAGAHEAAHDGGLAGTTGCDATGCHVDNISTQHGDVCATCHDSTDPLVVAAIAAGDVTCSACHPGAGAHEASHDGGFIPSDGCDPCHNSNISVQHDNQCDVCHASSDPNVIDAVATGQVGCAEACHPFYHGGRSPASSAVFYFDFQQEGEVTEGAAFKSVFPDSWNVAFDIDNGSWADGDATPHSGYSQTTAKCGVCHSVHRAPTNGTSAFATTDRGGTATTASRYASQAWTAADVDTQLLLKSTAQGACAYCHITSGPTKMYGGDATLAIVTGPAEYSWNEFYGHASNCVQCHAVHGANTFGGGAASKILKASGAKKLGNIPLVVQPEVYNDSPLYANQADMLAGVVKPAALADGVTPRDAAVTAHCTMCHANYSPDNNQMINPTYTNPNLFQPASWASANGTTTAIIVGAPVTALPGVPGITYTTAGGSAGSLIMKYKNHPMKNADEFFTSPGASAGVAGLISVSGTDSYTCTSCHNADRIVDDTTPGVFGGEYLISSFPHYTPGYYKFMKAMDQSAFDTPDTLAELMLGREGFFNSQVDGGGVSRPGKPAIMNDGYCKKCHTGVGEDF